jgi:hypothetical protein
MSLENETISILRQDSSKLDHAAALATLWNQKDAVSVNLSGKIPPLILLHLIFIANRSPYIHIYLLRSILGMKISDAEVASIAKVLQHHHQLRALSLGMNYFADENVL